MVTLRPSIQPLSLHPSHPTSLNSGDTLPWQCLSHLYLADLLLVLVSSSSYWHMRSICYLRHSTTSLSHPSRTASFLPPASSISFHRTPFPSPLSATLLLTSCLGHPSPTACACHVCPSKRFPQQLQNDGTKAESTSPGIHKSCQPQNVRKHCQGRKLEHDLQNPPIPKKARQSFFQKKPQDPFLRLQLAKKPRTCKIHGFCTEPEKPRGLKSRAKGLSEPTKPRGLKSCRRKVAGLKKMQEQPQCFKNTGYP